ncbi:probable LRR receptor-like serine/threonine-protein kinase IRK [Ipomoea triloba]|uniref:probable LRR receptor-like serine/threonine-protein kinase IRK n=1 Tax=Ipomoea triloba TaxID=35885 RepID=UPI00125DADED|nr:probable LRR receptor-like serine/threonine-protein kinase IRK [Ipomoea triloba]
MGMRGVLCFLFLSLLVLVRGLNPSLNDDVLGLIVFKSDIQDPNGKLVSWNEEDYSPCNWDGVKCNPRSNRVSELNLDDFGLSGKIGRGLLQLQFLRKLSLAKNNLTGGLSVGLTQLPNLRVMDLSQNSLSGPIPADFFQQCGSLRSISLAKNKFSGQIPESLSSCAALASLNLSSNQFSGVLPAGIWSLPSLRSLDLSDNLLKGEIPKDIEGLKNLRQINLRKNQIEGEVPDEIGDCLLLRSIDFSQNSLSGGLPSTMQKLSLCNELILKQNAFTGDFPEWIGEMNSLQTLDLSENNFSGEVPTSIANLQSLKVLNLSRNSISGSLPISMSSCINLLVLDASHNSLTGEVPSWLYKLGLKQVILSENRLTGSLDNAFATSMENSRQKIVALDMSHNNLSGEIPSALGDFDGLEFLNLSGNKLYGNIPNSIGKLKSLDMLDLSENELNGSIPTEIGEATSLRELRLQKNYLDGGIPASIGNCLSLMTLSLSHNNLTGPLPAALAKLASLQNVDLSFNKLTGSLPKQLADLVHLLSFNVSHNRLNGELPGGGFFNTISPSSVSGNPSLCGAAVNRSCNTVLPKPLVLNPNSTDDAPDTIPQAFAHKKKILSISALIAIGAAAVIVVGVIAITVLNMRVRSATSRSAAALTFSGGDDFSHSPSTDANSGKLVMFTGDPDFSTGAHALLNKDCELGRGGFGAVYRTVLGDGHPVAIKKLTVSSLVKSQEDFEREVKKLGKVRHPNLVTLEGYYWTPSLQLLIYEFVSGGNLYKRLHEGSGPNLAWSERFNLILGTAKSLAHLHQMNIVHYNIKSSNVLIDSSGEPKVADYGLARLLPMLDRYILSSKIQSALGYMAPEFACKTVKITEKCDVYGFGVLILEIVTGKKPVEYMEDDVVVICDMVRGALEDGGVEDCIDKRLQGKYPAEEAIPVMKLGLICTSQVPSNRPDMTEVVNILELIRCPSESHDELG